MTISATFEYMRTLFVSLALGLFISCTGSTTNCPGEGPQGEITLLLDSFHRAAAAAHFEEYFSFFTEDAVFIGTDATEHWDKAAFAAFSKPYFDKGKAWNFKAIERHIYLDKSERLAWFDELLDTQMKICRGSGVLRLENGKWKICQYVLSMTIPNDLTKVIVPLKTTEEDSLIQTLTNGKK